MLPPCLANLTVSSWFALAARKCWPGLACRSRLLHRQRALRLRLAFRLPDKSTEAEALLPTQNSVRRHERGVGADRGSCLVGG